MDKCPEAECNMEQNDLELLFKYVSVFWQHQSSPCIGQQKHLNLLRKPHHLRSERLDPKKRPES